MDVSLDFWPAVVTLPDGTVLEKVRVVVAGGRAIAFDSAQGLAVVSANVEAPEPNLRMNGFPYRVATNGGDWVVTRAQGCGCGSVLKALPREHLLTVAGVQ